MKVFFLESLFIFNTFKHVLFKCGDLSKLFLLKINLFFHFQILVLFALMAHGMVQTNIGHQMIQLQWQDRSFFGSFFVMTFFQELQKATRKQFVKKWRLFKSFLPKDVYIFLCKKMQQTNIFFELFSFVTHQHLMVFQLHVKLMLEVSQNKIWHWTLLVNIKPNSCLVLLTHF